MEGEEDLKCVERAAEIADTSYDLHNLSGIPTEVLVVLGVPAYLNLFDDVVTLEFLHCHREHRHVHHADLCCRIASSGQYLST